MLRPFAANMKFFTSLAFNRTIKPFSGRNKKIAGGALTVKALNE